MTPDQFCYWLQGYFELYGPQQINPTQTAMIAEHLALIFNKKTPYRILRGNEEWFNEANTCFTPTTDTIILAGNTCHTVTAPEPPPTRRGFDIWEFRKHLVC